MRLLLREAGLIDREARWVGGGATLWFIGDFFDRGPDGIGVIETIMRLQGEAEAAGGRVGALLGNHEPMLLAAKRFPREQTSYRWWTFLDAWEQNGGLERDRAALTPEHIAWLVALPAMALVGETILVHADAMFYWRYGATIAEVNAALGALLVGDDLAAWDRLLGEFAERGAFADWSTLGATNLERFLARYGGTQLIHGHTPLPRVLGSDPGQITGPLHYADGRCVNADGGIYLGGPGFVYRLPG
jgi:hypothetical protein